MNNEERIEYASFIIKEILGIKEDIKGNIKLKKTELERENANYKGRRVDFVAEIDNKIVNIEMNNNSSVATLIRNIKFFGFLIVDLPLI